VKCEVFRCRNMWVVEVETHKFLPLAPGKGKTSHIYTLATFFLGKKRFHMSVEKEILQNHDRLCIFLQNTNNFFLYFSFTLSKVSRLSAYLDMARCEGKNCKA